MKKIERIKKAILSDKKLTKKIKDQFNYSDTPIENFIDDCNRYIKAIKEGRMFCVIHSVSASGMSRVLSFHECKKGRNRYNFQQFYSLFKILGHEKTKNGFRVHGCGMDMVFHTNYCNIHTFGKLKILNKKQVEKLAQETPNYY